MKKAYIYDSLSGNKKPLTKTDVQLYVCGPTVYNHVHIGNIRPLITFDAFYRFLLKDGYKVQYLHNLTDIDDKIINRAEEENKSEHEVSEFYIKAYKQIMKSLGIKQMTMMPKVSTNIKSIIQYVDRLIKKGAGYVTPNGDVYFSIDKVKNIYGTLSKQKIDQLLNDVRKEAKGDKKNKLDFALWKQTDKGLSWKSPWNDKGRPGWHTECALFINKYMGDTITIHGGGIDLKFPHHENENAQNYALIGKPIAELWMHSGHINVNNVKMSKSLNNFILAKDLIAKYGSNAIRWFMYQTKYENPVNFSDELLNASANEIEKITNHIGNAIVQLKLGGISIATTNGKMSAEFIKAMENDLDFPLAVSEIWRQVKSLPDLIKNKKYKETKEVINNLFAEFDVLGLSFNSKLDAKTLSLITKWKKALSTKDYKTADSIRNKLIK